MRIGRIEFSPVPAPRSRVGDFVDSAPPPGPASREVQREAFVAAAVASGSTPERAEEDFARWWKHHRGT